MLIPVIISGGLGTRLWPVSRKSLPKPFVCINGNRSLLQQTYMRACQLQGVSDILTVTGKDYYFLTRDEYQNLALDADVHNEFLLEPEGRDTAAAVVMAALWVQENHPDANLLIMPADHLISDKENFQAAVKSAEQLAELGHLVTFGIKPTYPETAYGYIQLGSDIEGGFLAENFTEKPDLALAENYLKQGNFLWNSGLFCLNAKTIIDAYQTYQPDLYQKALNCWQATKNQEKPIVIDQQSFSVVPSTSFDYAIMEHADNCAVIPANFTWSDVGSWDAVHQLHDDNNKPDNAVLIDSARCFVHANNRAIAMIDMEDTLVVDTEDATLIAKMGSSQKVKQVLAHLQHHSSAYEHVTEKRPWGSFTILEDTKDYKVKRLVVKPGQVLSLQLHHRRSEHWTIVSGAAKVRLGDKEWLVHENESVYIPVETLHRLENPSKDENITIIEVQCGDYFGEDDIERFEDVYGRI